MTSKNAMNKKSVLVLALGMVLAGGAAAQHEGDAREGRRPGAVRRQEGQGGGRYEGRRGRPAGVRG